MANQKRSDFEQEVIDALIDSKAIDFEALGSLFSRYGEKAARTGNDLVAIINTHSVYACGWPGPELRPITNAEGQG